MTDHETCVAASHAGCSCGALAGRPCTGCATGWYHLSRFARARASRLLTGAQFARVIQDRDVYAGFTTVHDPGGSVMTAALIIFIAALIIFIGGIAGTWALLRWDDHRGDPGDGDREAATFRKIAHEIAHEKYLPAPLAACPAEPPPLRDGEYESVGYPAGLLYRYGHAGDDGTAPFVKDIPKDTLAPALQDATPEGGPSAGARAPEPPAGDEAPGPDGAPEGDEPAARPPQGTTGPGDLLAKAAAAVAALPVDKYLDEAGRTTAYADDRPWNPLSAETIARGMPAIKEEVAP